MTSGNLTEIVGLPPSGARLHERALAGEYFILRGAVKQLGLLDLMRDASLTGVRKAMSDATARRVREMGFERIHEATAHEDIPRITEAAYQEAARIQPRLLRQAVSAIVGADVRFYFEREPNVRFHIPYELAAAHRRLYTEFGKARGEGKISAHGPHRDSWLACPSNAVNFWIAVGSVETANGLAIYPEVYGKPVSHDGCYIDRSARPGIPTNTAMEAGDVLIFHGDQLHASVLNHSDLTRHVVSFRLTFGRPTFEHGHFHHYLFAPWAVGPLEKPPLRWVAEAPAKLSRGYFGTRLSEARNMARSALGRGATATERTKDGDAPPIVPPRGEEEASELGPRADSFSEGEIRAVDGRTCIARLAGARFVAFDRRCPHEGADLSLGYIKGERVHCPWHNLPFDLRTGVPPCAALKKLEISEVSVSDGRIRIARAGRAAQQARR